MRSWRALATRLRMTPATVTLGRQWAKPATKGATDWLRRSASTTRITGRPQRFRQIACGALSICGRIEQTHGPFDQEKIGARGLLDRQSAQLVLRHGPRVEIDGFPPRSAPGKLRVDVVRDRTWPAPPPGHAGGSAASRPSVITVLPEPERGAETISPLAKDMPPHFSDIPIQGGAIPSHRPDDDNGRSRNINQGLNAAESCFKGALFGGARRWKRSSPPRRACVRHP